jgi:hypothetical protein
VIGELPVFGPAQPRSSWFAELKQPGDYGSEQRKHGYNCENIARLYLDHLASPIPFR